MHHTGPGSHTECITLVQGPTLNALHWSRVPHWMCHPDPGSHTGYVIQILGRVMLEASSFRGSRFNWMRHPDPGSHCMRHAGQSLRASHGATRVRSDWTSHVNQGPTPDASGQNHTGRVTRGDKGHDASRAASVFSPCADPCRVDIGGLTHCPERKRPHHHVLGIARFSTMSRGVSRVAGSRAGSLCSDTHTHTRTHTQ